MTRLTWYSCSFLFLSSFLTLPINFNLSINNISINKIGNAKHLFSKNFSIQKSDSILKGKEIIFGGKKYQIAWIQWLNNNQLHTGISDIGIAKLLGLELLNSKNPRTQSARWLGDKSGNSISFSTKFMNPYRYLDVTKLMKLLEAKLLIKNNILELKFHSSLINYINQRKQAWKEKIFLDVDSTNIWQINKSKNKGMETVSDKVSRTNLHSNHIYSLLFNLNKKTNKKIHNTYPSTFNYFDNSLFLLKNREIKTEVYVNLSSTNVSGKVIIPKEIAWIPGIVWRKQLITVESNKKQNIFPVNLLEIDKKSSNIILKPITSNFNSQVGTSSLENIANKWQVVAAINGGFFNRKNKLPLGAIRRNHNWLSSPILGRAAIGWNKHGEVLIDNLSLQETLIMSSGEELPIQYLNSGYIQPGISRYTPKWGKKYTTISNNETIIVIDNDQVIDQQKSEHINHEGYHIPNDGYLLVIRKEAIKSDLFSIGKKIKIERNTIPSKFNQFTHILGAGPLLIKNKRIVLNVQTEQFTRGFQKQKASRSAIGITNKNKIILVTVHSSLRNNGVSLDEMAKIMKKLGSTGALNLDGGSSSGLLLGGHLIDRFPFTVSKVHNGIGVFIIQ